MEPISLRRVQIALMTHSRLASDGLLACYQRGAPHFGAGAPVAFHNANMRAVVMSAMQAM
jgi:Leu/Phe-tRNA-protein transferase